jgi:hypothetical protein
LALLSAHSKGCSRKSGSNAATGAATELRTPAFLLEKLKKSQIKEATSLSARAQISFDYDGPAMTVNANIHWIRDSIIWLNVKKFGIEAARVLVTRDSVFMLNRLEKTYSAQGLESLQRQYNLPEGFQLLQKTMLAQPWIFEDMPFQSALEEGMHTLKGTNGRFLAAYRLQENPYLMRRESFVEQKDSRVITLDFDRYEKVDGLGLFPYLRTVEAYSPETGNTKVDISLSDLEVNVEKAIRFEVPDHYKRI